MHADTAEVELINEIYRRFVHLVLYARKGDGTWTDDDHLTAFTVHLDDPVVVCINDEPHGYHPARACRELVQGEPVGFSDLEAKRVSRPAELAPPFVAAERTATRWHIRFDFRRTHPRAAQLLETGHEFFAVAQSALTHRRLRAFAENAFHAAESYAKAELLSYPVSSEEIEGSRKHSHVQSAYHLWARLGNTDKRFPALLRELCKLRDGATYVDGAYVPDETLAAEQLQLLRAMGEAAAEALGGGHRQISVIATREIAAGMMVAASDATLRPRRQRQSA